MTLKRLPSEERPREKLLSQGVSALSGAELLAILLGTGTRDKSALNLAGELLSMDESGLFYLSSCAPEELSALPGVGKAKACRILAAAELGRRLSSKPAGKRKAIGGPEDVARLCMAEMREYRKEHFQVLLLNAKGEVIQTDRASVGDLSSAIVHPREIFSNAVKRGAASVILVHNHPSGNPEPSRQDVETTGRLAEAGALLGIPVLDHIIIGDGTFVSLRDRNLIKTI